MHTAVFDQKFKRISFIYSQRKSGRTIKSAEFHRTERFSINWMRQSI